MFSSPSPAQRLLAGLARIRSADRHTCCSSSRCSRCRPPCSPVDSGSRSTSPLTTACATPRTSPTMASSSTRPTTTSRSCTTTSWSDTAKRSARRPGRIWDWTTRPSRELAPSRHVRRSRTRLRRCADDGRRLARSSTNRVRNCLGATTWARMPSDHLVCARALGRKRPDGAMPARPDRSDHCRRERAAHRSLDEGRVQGRLHHERRREKHRQVRPPACLRLGLCLVLGAVFLFFGRFTTLIAIARTIAVGLVRTFGDEEYKNVDDVVVEMGGAVVVCSLTPISAASPC
jgi:hypothetical protein